MMGQSRRYGVADLTTARVHRADEDVAVGEALEPCPFAHRQCTIFERMYEAASRDVVELRRDGVRRAVRVEPTEQICAVGPTHTPEPVGQEVRWDVAPG